MNSKRINDLSSLFWLILILQCMNERRIFSRKEQFLLKLGKEDEDFQDSEIASSKTSEQVSVFFTGH